MSEPLKITINDIAEIITALRDKGVALQINLVPMAKEENIPVNNVSDKQTPMKVELYDDGGYAKCPCCGKDDYEYEINDWGCNFCCDCGQALDWSDTE